MAKQKEVKMFETERVRLRYFICPRCHCVDGGYYIHGFHCTEEEEKKFNMFYVRCDGYTTDGFNGRLSGDYGHPGKVWIRKTDLLPIDHDGVAYYTLLKGERVPVIGKN